LPRQKAKNLLKTDWLYEKHLCSQSNFRPMSESSDFRQQAKAFLEGIFGTLDSMVSETMDKQHKDLSSLQTTLKSVQDEFVNDSSSILSEVENHLDQYKTKIQDILVSRPRPPRISAEIERISEEIDNEE